MLRIKLPPQVKLTASPNKLQMNKEGDSNNLVSLVRKKDVVENGEEYQELYIKANSRIDAGKYEITWNKNRNPRSFAPTGTFEVSSYDGVGSENDGLGNIIAEGVISNLRMREAMPIKTFTVEPKNKTNGLDTGYLIEFASDVPTEDGDQLYIKFPPQIKTPKQPVCKIDKCIEEIDCGSESSKIVITFKKLQQNCKAAGNTIKFGIEGIRNPTNGVTSDKITAYTLSANFQ